MITKAEFLKLSNYEEYKTLQDIGELEGLIVDEDTFAHWKKLNSGRSGSLVDSFPLVRKKPE